MHVDSERWIFVMEGLGVAITFDEDSEIGCEEVVFMGVQLLYVSLAALVEHSVFERLGACEESFEEGTMDQLRDDWAEVLGNVRHIPVEQSFKSIVMVVDQPVVHIFRIFFGQADADVRVEPSLEVELVKGDQGSTTIGSNLAPYEIWDSLNIAEWRPSGKREGAT